MTTLFKIFLSFLVLAYSHNSFGSDRNNESDFSHQEEVRNLIKAFHPLHYGEPRNYEKEFLEEIAENYITIQNTSITDNSQNLEKEVRLERLSFLLNLANNPPFIL